MSRPSLPNGRTREDRERERPPKAAQHQRRNPGHLLRCPLPAARTGSWRRCSPMVPSSVSASQKVQGGKPEFNIKIHSVVLASAAPHACYIPSVVSGSVRPYGQQPFRLRCPRDSPGKNAGVGCHIHQINSVSAAGSAGVRPALRSLQKAHRRAFKPPTLPRSGGSLEQGAKGWSGDADPPSLCDSPPGPALGRPMPHTAALHGPQSPKPGGV